jgi:hypothetical protein
MSPTDWAGLLSPVGCVVFLVIALSRGWLMQGSVVDRLTKQWEDRLDVAHVREQVWQNAAQVSEETRRDVADQLKSLQAISEAQLQILSAVRDGARSADPTH